MEKVIDLLTCERERTKRSIEWLKKEIKYGQKSNEKLLSPEFIEKHKNSSNWSEDWTIKQYIAVNVSSNNRAIAKYTEKLEDANDYLNQIERALTALNETTAVEEGFYRLREKYANAMKELEGRR